MFAEDKLHEMVPDYYFVFDKKDGELWWVIITYSDIRKGEETPSFINQRDFYTEAGKKMWEKQNAKR